jgi:peptidoglycan/LPS O-acetylase OafA/YrhL
MFGYLRFILAFFVLISHVNVRVFHMNPGVVAVVMFYLLAGHVVSHLWDNVLPKGRCRLARFYRDRALRILPMYLYITGLTLVFLAVTGYGAPHWSWLKLLGNLAVVPVNYYMVLDTAILTDPSWALIPTAWSLGAELQAYALLPLALVSRRWNLWLMGGSFLVYMLANAGVLHPDYFGYRLIFGVFFMFQTGACIQRTRFKPLNSGDLNLILPWLLWGVFILMGAVFSAFDLFGPAYTRETFLGMILGIPLVFFLGRTRIKARWNVLAGSLSYGVFLAHFLIIWLLDHLDAAAPGSGFHIPAVTAGSVLIALIGVTCLESRVDRIRKINI